MWFLGNASTPAIRAAMHAGELGMIITPAEGRAPLEGVVFGADNGCYGRGYPGEEKWLAWLAKWRPHAHHCLWATAPDVVGDAHATLRRSRPMLSRIRALGFPAALVAQDGAEHVRLPWSEFDVLFIGGRSTEWKLGPPAAALATEALRRGKPVHFGRVNSQKRWTYAHLLGCASVDGTCLAFAPDRHFAEVRRWIASTTPTYRSASREGDSMPLSIVPVTLRQAQEFIARHHRHHPPPHGMKFAIGVSADAALVGVAVVGRPVARHLDDNTTLEVTRSCTDGTRNANSMLYAAAWRITRDLGYHGLITYTHDGEPGTSLHAAGFNPTTHNRAHHGCNRPSRPRTTPNRPIARTRWELTRPPRTLCAPQRSRAAGPPPTTAPPDQAPSRSPGTSEQA